MAGTNPILDELSGLSPEAQQALRGAHAAAALAPQPPPVDQGLQAPSRIPKAPQMGAPPPTATPQMPNPTPSLSAPAAPSPTPPRGTLQGDINERGRREAEGPGITNIHSKIEGALPNHPTLGKALGYAAEVPLRGLEAVGSTLSPGVASLVPGTQLNFAREMRNLNSQIGKESEEQLKGAQTGEAQARTSAIEHPADEFTPLATEQGYVDVSKRTGQATPLTVNGEQAQPVEKPGAQSVHVLPDGKVISVSRDPKTGQSTASVVYEGDPAVKTEVKQLEINGKPHQVLINSATGATIKDLGETGEKPPVVNVHAGDAREFQEKERGRGLLDKAEAAYRTAEQGSNTMRDMVASARAGNKMSAQVLPLEGALAITTAQGVHRINRTEVDQYAGAGSLYDRIAARVGKLSAGQPIPPDILNDIVRLTDIQQRGAYQTYKEAHDSAVKRYNLQGEEPLPEPKGSGGGGAPQHKVGDTVSIKGKQMKITAVHPDGSFDAN